MLMYHSWDSQNVWLRQIMAQNYMYMNARRAAEMGIKDFDWIWVESHNGKIRCQLKTMEGMRGEHRLDLERHRQAEGCLGPEAKTPPKRPRDSCSTT